MIIPNIWENKKCSKPPTRFSSYASLPEANSYTSSFHRKNILTLFPSIKTVQENLPKKKQQRPATHAHNDNIWQRITPAGILLIILLILFLIILRADERPISDNSGEAVPAGFSAENTIGNPETLRVSMLPAKNGEIPGFPAEFLPNKNLERKRPPSHQPRASCMEPSVGPVGGIGPWTAQQVGRSQSHRDFAWGKDGLFAGHFCWFSYTTDVHSYFCGPKDDLNVANCRLSHAIICDFS